MPSNRFLHINAADGPGEVGMGKTTFRITFHRKPRRISSQALSVTAD